MSPVDFSIVRRDDNLDDARARCAICLEWLPLELIMGHLRGAHGIEDDLATWPDGSPVIIDQTLEPGDFGDALPGSFTERQPE